MRPVDEAARAIAAIEGDPDALVEIPTSRGLTRVPAWQLYRVRARAALAAVKVDICQRLSEKLWVDEEPTRGDIEAAWDEAVA